MLAYLRVIANPNDEVSLTRIVNVPARGLGDTSIKQSPPGRPAQGITLLEAMARAEQIPGLSTRAMNAAKQFADLVRSWQALAADGTAAGMFEGNAAGTVQKVMEKSSPRAASKPTTRKRAATNKPSWPTSAN